MQSETSISACLGTGIGVQSKGRISLFKVQGTWETKVDRLVLSVRLIFQPEFSLQPRFAVRMGVGFGPCHFLVGPRPDLK